MILAQLIHIGFNFWDDRPNSYEVELFSDRLAADHLRCDDETWNLTLQTLADSGANMVILDLGEGLRFESCPELAVPDAWTKERLAGELTRLRAMGLTPIPKINFSACHDAWMGEYQRMIGTAAYYDFCKNIIAEALELFGKPEYFHIGMDEENARLQRHLSHCVIRQHELWYRDLNFYAEHASRTGARPWMWSDKIWEDEENFVKNVSRDILQSNWYYGLDLFGEREPLPGEKNFNRPEHITYFEKLGRAGFDQVPAGSNYANTENMELLGKYSAEKIDASRLKGLMQTTWFPTIQANNQRMVEAAQQLGRAGEHLKAL